MEGFEICSKCDGAGAIAKKHPSDDIITVDCPKCYGSGKIDWVTNAMGAIKNSEFFHSSSPILTASQDNDITFYIQGKEVIKTTPNGFYIKGNKISDDKKLYGAFVDFFKKSGTYI